MQIKKFEFKSFGFEDTLIDEKPLEDDIPQIEIPEINLETEEAPHITEQIEQEATKEATKIEIAELVQSEEKETSNDEIIQILNKINNHLEYFSQQVEDKIKNISKDLSFLALELAKKIAGRALDKNPMPEVEIFLEDSFRFYREENELTISLNPNMLESVSQKFEELYPDFMAKHDVRFIEKSEFSKSDCQIDWHNGSLVFNKDEIIKRIEKFF